MKQTYVKYLMVVALTGGFLFTSCRTAREYGTVRSNQSRGWHDND